jgi:dsRNA-specific ribonuclease
MSNSQSSASNAIPRITPTQTNNLNGGNSDFPNKVLENQNHKQSSSTSPSQINNLPSYVTSDYIWKLKKKIVEILSPVLKESASGKINSILNEEQLVKEYPFTSKLIENDTIKTWLHAFTFKTVNYSKNYEVLEAVGNGILDHIFCKYLYKEYPDLKESEIVSQTKSYFLAKEKFAEFSRSWGLTELLITNENLNNSRAEDVFESFFGALEEVSDSKLPLGYGFYICYNLFVSILVTQNISMEMDYYKYSASSLKELLEALKLGNKPSMFMHDTKATNSHIVTVTIVLPTENEIRENRDFSLFPFELIKRYIPNFPFGRVIGIGQGDTKKKAKEVAAEKAIENLREIGITKAKVDKILETTEEKDLISQAKLKASRNGYSDITVVKGSTDSSGETQFHLMGLIPDGDYISMKLNVVSKSSNRKQGTLETFRRYLQI